MTQAAIYVRISQGPEGAGLGVARQQEDSEALCNRLGRPLIGWHIDRLTRSPRELENVIDLADRDGLKLATYTGDIDLATPTGRMVARILGATARQESEHRSTDGRLASDRL